MSHFTREREDQDWYRGLKVPHTLIRNIDEKTKKAISGTGANITPSNPIILGGAGLELQCGVQLSSSAKVQPAEGKKYIFGADDYFKFETPVQRMLCDTPFLLQGNRTLFREALAVVDTSGTAATGIKTRRPGAFLRMPIRLPDGVRLSLVEVFFTITQVHAAFPTYLPKARVVRIDAGGNVEQHPSPMSVALMPSGTTTFDVDGWFTMIKPPLPASYSGGILTLSFDADEVDPTDTSEYGYAVEWIEESGTNSFTGTSGSLITMLRSTYYHDDLRPY